DDRVVDEYHLPTLQRLGDGIEFEADPPVTHQLAGLDEGATDIAILDETVGIGDAAAGAESLGGRDPRLRYRDHDVGLHRVLVGEDLPHPATGGVHRLAVEAAVRAG